MASYMVRKNPKNPRSFFSKNSYLHQAPPQCSYRSWNRTGALILHLFLRQYRSAESRHNFDY
ncbi:UNVERIFIED_CONTAM: hypothetical protein Sangu_1294800 [Sesamum angustifolium]|uniref:Uncharacterized protein n=1 Tax=Sesamum angustifolium TaxID=2727405 RepID=A0AAW2NKA1_9LAMI